MGSGRVLQAQCAVQESAQLCDWAVRYEADLALLDGSLMQLGLALLGDGDSERSLSRSYAWYLALECVGSQCGAAAMGRVRDTRGETAMFPLGAAIVGGVLLMWLVLTPACGLARREYISSRYPQAGGRGQWFR